MDLKSDARRPLIVVIDEDDDIGATLGRSLVMGYKDVVDAATQFAILRPEDPDSNAMFVGLNLYKEMEADGRNPEIIVVGGHPKNALLAQSLIKARVQQAISKSPGNYELYVVGDGLDELFMAQILRDVGPIAGVKQVIVEQSLGVEGSYILLARYIRKALNDPRYSKYFLGLPGLLLLVFGLLTIFGYLLLSLKIMAALLGFFMVVKGFNLESQLWEYLKTTAARVREGSVFQLAGLGTLAISVVISAYGAYILSRSAAPLTDKVGYVVSYEVTTLIIGMVIYVIIASVFFKVSRRNFRLYREAQVISVLIMLAAGLYYMGLSIASTPLPSTLNGSYVYSILIGSGFLVYALTGAAIAALIEIGVRVKSHEPS
ncbi:hypothetical protein ASAC_0214 [Acidilobus saccharovorans 345-15]|uniref:DUF373 family protein n=1 Tax=Acidilobus saccharovorans (strain DSM 16705 / JCM 18335 / VKM B-2471 / 345-15) TaxID=666510 RepID=D9PZY3_ACIS3|nr:DUF373 family protein [Acidilobus saccharovorans]ADL18621.1 hypothetical protein ASAC_0214 [Acidilobus saccharovorans 345-15]